VKRSRKVLASLLGLYVVYGALLPHIARGAENLRAAQLLLGFPTAIALFWWCKLDATERGIVSPSAAPLLVGALAPFGVPYYFLRTMPLRSALLAIIRAVLFYVGMCIAESLASYVSARPVV
jgi:apolipoprotein N-acyltransferase